MANFGEYMTFKNGKKDLLVDGMIILMIVLFTRILILGSRVIGVRLRTEIVLLICQ